MASGSIGYAGSQINFESAQSINCQMPDYTYPKGTVYFSLAQGVNYWYNRGVYNPTVVDMWLCDSNGDNKVYLFTITLRPSNSDYTTTTATVDAPGLAGKALYLIATKNSQSHASAQAKNIELRNATAISIDTVTQSFTLTTAVSPAGTGSVTAGGSMAYGATKSLTATAATGYSFSSWSKTAGTLSSTTSNPTTFTMGGSNATVTANFAVNSYTLTVAKGTGIASVTGGGSVNYGSSNNISATASTGYTFSGWTSNNGGTFGNASAASTTFTMPAGNTTVTASATVNSYTLTVAKGTGGSSVTGGGTVNYGSSNNISATAATGYTFKNWTSNNGGTFGNANSASTTFTMPAGNTTVTANFTINSYALTTTVSPSGGGTVTAGATLNYGATKSLTATPATGYSFSSWSKTAGSLSSTTSNPTTFTMGAGAATVTANFTKNSYKLTTAVSPSGYGSVTAGATLEYGATKSLTATANSGRYFSSWSKTAGSLSSTTANPTTFTMGAGAATVTANFGTNTYTLTVAKGTGISAVTGGGSKAYASANDITATVSSGYTFKNWTSNNGGTFANANSSSTKFTMPAGNATVTANATVNSYTLTVAKGTGGASVTGGGTVNYGSSNNISATAATGYTFKNWTSNNGGTFGNANAASTTFTMPVGNTTVTANFTINSYTLTTAASPAAGGSVTAGGSMNYGATKSLTATAATGYSFSSWSKTAGTLSSTTTNPTTFTMGTSAATVTASFTHNTYTLSKASSPTAGGTVTLGATSGYYNDQINISATANTGYSFSQWSTTGGTIASASSASTKITMPAANTTVTATFTQNNYSLTGAVSPSGGGTVTLGANSAHYNDQVTITATPATGYAFSGWTTTGGTIANENATSTTITMPAANATVTAAFTKINYTVTAVSDPAVGGTVTATPSTATYGDTVTLSQTPTFAYAFDGYTSSPSVTIENDQFTMPNGNVTITGNYHITKSSGSLDKAAYTAGDTAVLSIQLASSEFTHRFRMSFGTGMETQWTTLASGVDTADIYIPLLWATNAGGRTTVTGGVLELETYDGSTLLGTDTITNLSYSVPDATIPELHVWRCDALGNEDIFGEYVGYQPILPESAMYTIAHGTEPLAAGANYPVTMTVVFGEESFMISRDLPKVTIAKKKIIE